jgi:hypothetical protein
MGSLVQCAGFDESRGMQPEHEEPPSSGRSLSFFQTIPPERVGLNGEYDHSGLAKRVECAFRQQFQPETLELLQIAQRGGVVILAGQVLDQQVLDQLVDTATTILGAMAVEAYGVKLIKSTIQPSKSAVARSLSLDRWHNR